MLSHESVPEPGLGRRLGVAMRGFLFVFFFVFFFNLFLPDVYSACTGLLRFSPPHLKHKRGEDDVCLAIAENARRGVMASRMRGGGKRGHNGDIIHRGNRPDKLASTLDLRLLVVSSWTACAVLQRRGLRLGGS